MDAAVLTAAVLRWLVPALVVFGVAALAVIAIGLGLRAARRSPRARAEAERARTAAGSALVRLDDAVEELDLEVGLSGAMYGGDAPPGLRRARMTAQHVRDRSFDEFRALGDDGLLPDEVRRRASRIAGRVDEVLAQVAHARAEHEDWMQRNTSAAAQIEAARGRLQLLREQIGDPGALVRTLSDRFDESEWTDAAAAASTVQDDLDQATALLDRAGAAAADPTRSALADLGLAERRIRAARCAAQRLEDVHRAVTQAAAAVAGEHDAAREAIRQALNVRENLEPDASQRLGAAIDEAQARLDEAVRDAARRPTATVEAIARLRDRLDLALGDARTAQQRLRGARTALPGTIAAAQNAIAHAEASVAGAGADARVRLAAARDELAKARQPVDPVEALDAARRAMRHAEDAQALAAYDRMTGS
ncbi:hypothetical protein [Microbacterium luticocti]|uniref:hypothetical protein n=1 Tax=Microbacterium luticocti TaxID=451764 RepID=UPI00041B98D8|nr:hypothetical protein [Microbacterium luticocti]